MIQKRSTVFYRLFRVPIKKIENKQFAGSRESREYPIEALSAPASPIDQTNIASIKLNYIGRNPLRGSKCNFL